MAKPMPRAWYDRHAVNQIEDETLRAFYKSIIADRKPYFMTYIYPDLMKQYNTYINNTNRNALREFQLTVRQLMEMRYDALTERQREFLRYYSIYMPVGTGSCVMNKICHRFEEEYDGFVGKSAQSDFDYSIMKSEEKYTNRQYSSVLKLYKEYNQKLKNYATYVKYERVADDEAAATTSGLKDEFIRECAEVCPNQYALCNILLDICYSKATTKKFAWDMCADTIVENLIRRAGGVISYPAPCADGDIEYCGERFSIKEVEVINDEYSAE